MHTVYFHVRDALELTILTFLLLMLTPLLASWSVQSIRKSVFVFKFLASSLNKVDLLKIIIIYYNARCDNLLLHGDIAENPGPSLVIYALECKLAIR